MTDELDRAEEELSQLQQRLQERDRELKKLSHAHTHGHGHSTASPAASPSPSPLLSSPAPPICGHSALFSQLQLHVQRVDDVVQQSVALSKRIQSQTQPQVSSSSSSSSDESIGAVEIATPSDTLSNEVVSLCAEQSPLLSQAIGELAVIRELVDPVAVVLASPSLVPLPAAMATSSSSSHGVASSPRRSRYDDGAYVDEESVIRERDEYKHQLDMQQVRHRYAPIMYTTMCYV